MLKFVAPKRMKTKGRVYAISISMMALELLPRGPPPWLQWLATAEPALASLSVSSTHLLAFIYLCEQGHLKSGQQADGPALDSFVIPNCAVMWTWVSCFLATLLKDVACSCPYRCPGRWPFPSHSYLESDPSCLPLSHSQDSQSWDTPSPQNCPSVF